MRAGLKGGTLAARLVGHPLGTGGGGLACHRGRPGRGTPRHLVPTGVVEGTLGLAPGGSKAGVARAARAQRRATGSGGRAWPGGLARPLAEGLGGAWHGRSRAGVGHSPSPLRVLGRGGRRSRVARRLAAPRRTRPARVATLCRPEPGSTSLLRRPYRTRTRRPPLPSGFTWTPTPWCRARLRRQTCGSGFDAGFSTKTCPYGRGERGASHPSPQSLETCATRLRRRAGLGRKRRRPSSSSSSCSKGGTRRRRHLPPPPRPPPQRLPRGAGLHMGAAPPPPRLVKRTWTPLP